MTKVYLSLGSNLGDREANLRAGITALADASLHAIRVSSIYETEPVDYLDQGWFLNCVVEAETEMSSLDLLRKLRDIESRLGSGKLIPKGPRILDMDILLYGDETIATKDLQVPHPRMALRRFVLAPLAELAPQLRHPTWPATAAELLADLRDSSVVRPIA